MDTMYKRAQGLATIIVLVIAALIGIQKGFAMGFFTEKACLFTGFKGTLTYNGKPASGAEIVLTIAASQGSNIQKVEHQYTTDDKGVFVIESVYGKQKTKTLSEFVVNSEIHVNYDGNHYEIWVGGKLGGSENDEFGGSHPGDISCDLDDDLIRVIPNISVMTKCRW